MKFTKEQLDEGLIKPGEFIELCSNDINGSVKFDQNRLKLLNKAAAEYARMQWRGDMENAPRDGTVIFVWLGNDEFPSRTEARWREPTEGEYWVSGSDYPDPKEGTFNAEAGWFDENGFSTNKLQGDSLPTHWMYQPEPPKQEDGE